MQEKKLLIADDEYGIVLALSEFFKLYDYEVTTASSISETKSALESNYDVLIIDFNMCDGDAGALISEIIDSERKIMIIIMSGENKDQLIDKYPALSSCQFINKPFETRDLALLINQNN